MKKITLKNSSRLMMSALLLPFVISSCQKNTQDILPGNSDDATSSAQYRRTGLSPVALKVTVSDASGYKITSDGGGDYVNGSRTVSANFDGYGNFIFATGATSNKPGSPLVRWLSVNLDDPIVIYKTPPVSGANNQAGGLSTGQVEGVSFTPMQSMTVGQTQCIGLTLGGGYWVVNFHRPPEDISTSQAAYVVVTRINDTQWTMQPVGECSPNSNVGALRYGTANLYGYYNLPFLFTLTKL
jgi:hypothetical protein